MIEFRYDFTTEEWHQWNGQYHIQKWKQDVDDIQQEKMTKNGEFLVKEFSHGHLRTFVCRKQNA